MSNSCVYSAYITLPLRAWSFLAERCLVFFRVLKLNIRLRLPCRPLVPATCSREPVLVATLDFADKPRSVEFLERCSRPNIQYLIIPFIFSMQLLTALVRASFYVWHFKLVSLFNLHNEN